MDYPSYSVAPLNDGGAPQPRIPIPKAHPGNQNGFPVPAAFPNYQGNAAFPLNNQSVLPVIGQPLILLHGLKSVTGAYIPPGSVGRLMGFTPPYNGAEVPVQFSTAYVVQFMTIDHTGTEPPRFETTTLYRSDFQIAPPGYNKDGGAPHAHGCKCGKPHPPQSLPPRPEHKRPQAPAPPQQGYPFGYPYPHGQPQPPTTPPFRPGQGGGSNPFEHYRH